MKKSDIKQQIDICIKKIDYGMKTIPLGMFPQGGSDNNVYKVQNNTGWTTGFWTGMLWLSYEFTGDTKYKDRALEEVNDYRKRIIEKIDVEHHDMGFLYSPSCVAAYNIVGSATAKEAALLAADNLKSRFIENGQYIQAWGKCGSPENSRLIIDCMLNLPLLFWASNVTGDNTYRNIALKHLNTSSKVVIRDDGSTYHTYFFDPETGKPSYGVTHQGYSDNSIWARGQAWGIYGFALAYNATNDKLMIDNFRRVTDVFLNRLPTDNVPAWDMIFNDNDAEKDTSAAVIAICGILEMSKHLDIPEYLEKAYVMMDALKDTCIAPDSLKSNGILMHTVGAMPQKQCIDEFSIWGDYYYMEVLMRMKNPNWKSYWI